MATRVLLVDDHPIVRAGLQTLLEQADGIRVVGQAGSGEEALAELDHTRPDVVLCDLRLGPGLDGVATTKAMGQTAVPLAVLILTTYDNDTDIVRAVEAGAVGYLLKDANPADIVDAIHRAARGETVLSPDMTERVITTMRRPRISLSNREREVLALVADGMSNRDIAHHLFLSEATVKTHLNHAFAKLAVENRTSAIATARAAGLLD